MPVCGKIFEKILFKSFYKYEDDYNILNGSKSGFCPGNSCVHLLLSVTNENYKTLDANPSLEVTEVFQYLLKAFDKG